MQNKTVLRLSHNPGGKDIIYQQFLGHIEYPVSGITRDPNHNPLTKCNVPGAVYPHCCPSGQNTEDVFALCVDMFGDFHPCRNLHCEYGRALFSKSSRRYYFLYRNVSYRGVVLPREGLRIEKSFHHTLLWIR